MEHKSCCTPTKKQEDGLCSSNISSVGPATNHQAVIPKFPFFQRVSTGSTDGMIYLDGGTFTMSSNAGLGYDADGEGPEREVTIDPFYIDQYSVTNAQFQEFVKKTKYKTEAERFGNSFLFHLLVPPFLKDPNENRLLELDWWYQVEGACWKKPEGPRSSIKKRMNHPVVHVSWNDAMEYCDWAGKRLLTEAEWEFAARNDSPGLIFPWGNELTPNGEFMCNTFNGDFPHVNDMSDGYLGTCAVTAFEPNKYGISNMIGNVWEWTNDWFDITYHKTQRDTNPVGPPTGERKTMKGGSYLCHDSYCNRYRITARTSNTPDSSTGNMGFRCARDI